MDTTPVMGIFNGTYTLKNPRSGEHRTLDISTQKEKAKFAPGERLISLLNGPDNTANYQNFGFVTPNGIVVWKRYRGQNGEKSAYEKLAAMLWSLWTLREKSPYSSQFGISLIESCNCVYCNRKLSDPLSALTGVGPECAAMRGINREVLPKRKAHTD